MTDTISLTEWIAHQQGAVVATLFLLAGALALWRDWIVTGRRHTEVVNSLQRQNEETSQDRDWWRERTMERERELETNADYHERVIQAIETMADMLHVLLGEQQRNWFSRWRP